MSESNPVTKSELLTSVGKSLDAHKRLREVMAQVAQEVSIARQQDKAQGTR